MELVNQIRYYTRRILLTFLGPAEQDDQHDPLKILNREWEAHKADRRRARNGDQSPV